MGDSVSDGWVLLQFRRLLREIRMEIDLQVMGMPPSPAAIALSVESHGLGRGIQHLTDVIEERRAGNDT